MIMSEAELQQKILTIIGDAERRLTLADIQKELSCRNRNEKSALRSVMRALIDQSELMYVVENGHTFIETALNKPVRISGRVVIKPDNCNFKSNSGDVVINMGHGISFGSGQHATTRLCLKGLETLIKLRPELVALEHTSALDIGTGSGILIIAAVQMGLKRGMGIDLDPISISEAKRNVRINTLDDCIRISPQAFESIQDSFDLIIANLRWPTLSAYLPKMKQNLKLDGFLLLSGIQSQERDALVATGEQNRLKLVWREHAKGWVAVGFQK